MFNIRRLVIMGGSAGRGGFRQMRNSISLSTRKSRREECSHSGLEIVMCGLDVTNRALLAADYLATLPTL